MSVITPESQQFIDKWAVLFADNEFENITEATLRAFTADVATLHEQGQYRALLLTASANSAESLLAGKTVQPGRLYAITGTPDPLDPAGLSGTWNASGQEETLYVVGLAPALFASLGCLLDVATGTTRPVQVDVLAGQYQALAAGAPAGPAVSAQLLGLDLSTGELLILLSPGAPATKASYVLAEYGPGTTPPAPSGGFPYAFPASIP